MPGSEPVTITIRDRRKAAGAVNVEQKGFHLRLNWNTHFSRRIEPARWLDGLILSHKTTQFGREGLTVCGLLDKSVQR
jgi:hypothetical protein